MKRNADGSLEVSPEVIIAAILLLRFLIERYL